MKKRLNFSSKTKALIFVRDKWICAFSWKILWIFHNWVSCTYDSDWADHIKPASSWWNNSLENWICSSSFYNSKKKDNWFDNKYLFFWWKPTIDFFKIISFLPEELKKYIEDMENLEKNDYYFNRALKNLLVWVEVLNKPFDKNGKFLKRQNDYWCKASLKNIQKFLKNYKWKEEFLNRLNINLEKISEDQKIMLEILEVKNLEDMIKISNKLLPFFKNSLNFFEEKVLLETKEEKEKFYEKVKNEKFLWNRDKEILLQ